MSKPIVIVGLGEMGGALAHGWLRCGRTVVPVNRSDRLARVDVDPELVLVAVAETDLSAVLASLPERVKDRVALLQNELLPVDWERHGITDPSVACVWFEKKKNRPLHVVLPSPVAGPHAELVVAAIAALGLPAECISGAALLTELVTKNLYILTSNIAGLEVGGTVAELWRDHRELATDVAREVLAIQSWRAGAPLVPEALIAKMVHAFEGDPGHACTGRSAPARLERALAHAAEAGLAVPTLSSLAERRLRSA